MTYKQQFNKRFWGKSGAKGEGLASGSTLRSLHQHLQQAKGPEGWRGRGGGEGSAGSGTHRELLCAGAAGTGGGDARSPAVRGGPEDAGGATGGRPVRGVEVVVVVVMLEVVVGA